MKVVEPRLLARSRLRFEVPPAIRHACCLQSPTAVPDMCQDDPSRPWHSTRCQLSASSPRPTEYRESANYRPNMRLMFRSTVMEEYRDGGERCRARLQWRRELSMNQDWSPPGCARLSRSRAALR